MEKSNVARKVKHNQRKGDCKIETVVCPGVEHMRTLIALLRRSIFPFGAAKFCRQTPEKARSRSPLLRKLKMIRGKGPYT
jgi:hypothetical protein